MGMTSVCMNEPPVLATASAAMRRQVPRGSAGAGSVRSWAMFHRLRSFVFRSWSAARPLVVCGPGLMRRTVDVGPCNITDSAGAAWAGVHGWNWAGARARIRLDSRTLVR
ncbi:hypothetical protein GCM10023167_05100 [Brevibacterium pityocampae]|uniref:Uncharacterized protein n=1 Tax=Brevibacterium pityocampae TaxID=506594 RepID=A0ABP8J3I9_9MICO